MANSNAPFGLRSLQTLEGSTAFANNTFVAGISKEDSTKIFTGDPLMRNNTGYVSQWTAGTAVSQMIGIFAGCSYYSISQGRLWYNNYWPGADAQSDVTAYYIPCNLAIPMLFQVQTDATGVTFADIGLNFDLTMGTGNTLNGRSGAVLNATTPGAVTATLPFRLVGLWSTAMGGQVGPGTQAGAYNWAIVAANVSGAGSTGI